LFAQQLISNEVFPLKYSDSEEFASGLMEDWNVKGLPVVQNDTVLGHVFFDELDPHKKNSIETIIKKEAYFKVPNFLHFFDLVKVFNETKLSVLAIVDKNDVFQGIVAKSDLVKFLCEKTNLSNEGGTIVLEMNAVNYSLAEISRITESNDIKIISVLLSTVDDGSNTINVSLKFNKHNLKYVISTFERFGYLVVYNSPFEEDVTYEDRYNWLLKFINS